MTDEQILNALKSCGDGIAICDDCPYYGKNHCSILAKQDIIKRFNALKAENAALRERLDKAVELPVKVGDTLYEIIDREVQGERVEEFRINKAGIWATLRLGFGASSILLNEGRNVFLTREAAEARLAELKAESK